jgi:chorismate synthase
VGGIVECFATGVPAGLGESVGDYAALAVAGL